MSDVDGVYDLPPGTDGPKLPRVLKTALKCFSDHPMENMTGGVE